MPPARIARELVRIGEHVPEMIVSVRREADGPDFAQILALIRKRTGIDFASYKRATIRRRMQRRLVIKGVRELREYAELLEREPEEITALFEDVLIHVTGFFREPEVFEALRTTAEPARARGPAAPRRGKVVEGNRNSVADRAADRGNTSSAADREARAAIHRRADQVRDSYLATEERSAATSFALPLLSSERLLGVVVCELGARLDARDFATLDSLGVVLGALMDRAVREDNARACAEWSGVVAHALRQPLAAMALLAQWLADHEPRDAVAAMARRMSHTVARLNRLVTELTDASMLHLGRIRLDPAPVDLVTLTKDVMELHGGGDGSGIPVRVTGEIPQLALDADRIEQVVSNLVTNAEKHGRPGAKIEVSIERRSGDVLLSVTNDGPAIPEGQLRSVFDRFFRGDSTQANGLGVGLYICRGLVEAHGGSISVTPEGDSTTFCVLLPLPVARPALVSTRLCSARALGAAG